MPSNTTYNPGNINDFVKIALNYAGTGVSSSAAPGTTTSIDHILTDDMLLTGAQVLANMPVFGDSMTFQVMDKTGVFYPAGTVLNTFISNWQCTSDFQEQIDANINYPAKIPAGLCLRLIYTSTGTASVAVSINYDLHKILL
jgi:hypothetical protein